MTKQEVLDSSWGYPNDMQKRTTENGSTEMWVYPDYNFIHFENGKVVTINESSY